MSDTKLDKALSKIRAFNYKNFKARDTSDITMETYFLVMYRCEYLCFSRVFRLYHETGGYRELSTFNSLPTLLNGLHNKKNKEHE